MAPANIYLPQAEFLVVVFADLFHSSHTLSKISFSFLENPKLQKKQAFEQVCVQIMNIQVIFLNAILYFCKNFKYFSFKKIFMNFKPNLIKTLETLKKT